MLGSRTTAHRSRVMPAKQARKQIMPQPDSDDVPLDFEVERIIAHDLSTGAMRYLVKWKNYTTTESTWEPEKNLDCLELLEAYWNLPSKKALRQSAAKGVFHSKPSGGVGTGAMQKKRGRPPGSKNTGRTPAGHHVADSTTADRDEDRRVRSVSKAASGRSGGTNGQATRKQGGNSEAVEHHSKRKNSEKMLAYGAGEISSLIVYGEDDECEFTGVINPENPEEELMIPVHMVYTGDWKPDKSRTSRSRSANEPIPVVPIKRARTEHAPRNNSSPESTD